MSECQASSGARARSPLFCLTGCRASASPRQTRCHGPADTGLGVRAAATALDLDFISAAWEEFDLILSGNMLAAAEPLIAAIRESSRRWQHLAVTT